MGLLSDEWRSFPPALSEITNENAGINNMGLYHISVALKQIMESGMEAELYENNWQHLRVALPLILASEMDDWTVLSSPHGFLRVVIAVSRHPSIFKDRGLLRILVNAAGYSLGRTYTEGNGIALLTAAVNKIDGSGSVIAKSIHYFHFLPESPRFLFYVLAERSLEKGVDPLTVVNTVDKVTAGDGRFTEQHLLAGVELLAHPENADVPVEWVLAMVGEV